MESCSEVVCRYKCQTKKAYVVGLAANRCSQQQTFAAVVTGANGVSAVEVLDSTPGGFKLVQKLEGHKGPIRDCDFLNRSPNCLVTCGEDGSCRLWDLRASQQEVQKRLFMPSGADPAMSVSASIDDAVVACAAGMQIHVLDIASGKQLRTLGEAHSEPLGCVRFHPTRTKELISAGDDGLVCALDSARDFGATADDDDGGLRVVINTEEAVRSMSFLGEEAGAVAVFSTTDVLQVWSFDEKRPGALCVTCRDVRSDPRLCIDETEGYLVGTLFEQKCGRSWILAGAVNGSLALYHLNLEGAAFVSGLPSGKAGHTATVRAVLPFSGSSLANGRAEGADSNCPSSPFVTAGEDGQVCLWRCSSQAGPKQSSSKSRKSSKNRKRSRSAKKRK
eukprot:TRINITY_DN36406_c0_g1_i1.p1 TRINITY_DN36406_c0_g1~~TRINITY_DN36406_c0_g1_i1.p1  ORF type:complete len:391 (+),score=44.45 TRINITY_DN36406_c0_g1_i1:273-1445(+)